MEIRRREFLAFIRTAAGRTLDRTDGERALILLGDCRGNCSVGRIGGLNLMRFQSLGH